MKCTYLPGILAVVLTFGSIGMAYPTFDTKTGIIGQPHTYTVVSSSVVVSADWFSHAGKSVKTRLLYGAYETVESAALLSPGKVDKTSIGAIGRFIHNLTNYKLTNDSSLAIVVSSHGAYHVQYSLHY